MFSDRTAITVRTGDVKVKCLGHLLLVAKISKDGPDQVRATQLWVMVVVCPRLHGSGFGNGCASISAFMCTY